eukprot:6182946-Pleurochrysis_carterae.AAC.1
MRAHRSCTACVHCVLERCVLERCSAITTNAAFGASLPSITSFAPSGALRPRPHLPHTDAALHVAVSDGGRRGCVVRSERRVRIAVHARDVAPPQSVWVRFHHVAWYALAPVSAVGERLHVLGRARLAPSVAVGADVGVVWADAAALLREPRAQPVCLDHGAP